MCLVELLLLAHKEETNLGIVNHKLYLLFAAGGIERDANATDTPDSEIDEEILHRILREDTDIFLFSNSQCQQSIGHLADDS